MRLTALDEHSKRILVKLRNSAVQRGLVTRDFNLFLPLAVNLMSPPRCHDVNDP